MNASFVRSLGVAVAAAVVTALPASAGASAPAGRYTYTPTSVTVTDTKTKLVWQRSAAAAMSQTAAKSYCASASTSASLGGTGWRLPTFKELLTIVDYSRQSPSIDLDAFPGTPSNYFWSSTPLAGSSSLAWVLYFGSGSPGTDDVSGTEAVRCVR